MGEKLTRSQERKRRLALMARIIDEMENGVYAWPDGRNPYHKDGTPVVVKAEAMRAAGYTVQRKYSNMTKLFEDPYYKEQLRLIRESRNRSLVTYLTQNEDYDQDITKIARFMLTELKRRLEEEPESFKTKELIDGANIYSKLAMSIDARTKDTSIERIREALASSQRLPADSRDKVVKKLGEFRAMRASEIEEANITGSNRDVVEIIDEP